MAIQQTIPALVAESHDCSRLDRRLPRGRGRANLVVDRFARAGEGTRCRLADGDGEAAPPLKRERANVPSINRLRPRGSRRAMAEAPRVRRRLPAPRWQSRAKQTRRRTAIPDPPRQSAGRASRSAGRSRSAPSPGASIPHSGLRNGDAEFSDFKQGSGANGTTVLGTRNGIAEFSDFKQGGQSSATSADARGSGSGSGRGDGSGSDNAAVNSQPTAVLRNPQMSAEELQEAEQRFNLREPAKDEAIAALTPGYGKLDEQVKKITGNVQYELDENEAS